MNNLNVKMYESEFEKAVVELLQNAGYQYTFGENLHRKVTDALLEDDLKEFLLATYSTQGITDDDIDAIISNLRNTSGATDFLSLRNCVLLYQDGYDYKPQKKDVRTFHLNYIDFETPEKNIFRVVNQVEFLQRNQTRIPDVLLYINGIPVCIIELKNPTDENATIRDAHTQITTRYTRDIPELLKFCSVAVISDGSNSRMGTTYTPYEYFYAWKKVENTDLAGEGLNQLTSLINGALKPERLLSIIRDFVYFPDIAEGKETEAEFICRYPQFFATQKLKENIILHSKALGGDGKGGLYFGATGCGKTLTMLFLARQLVKRCTDKIGSPTILIIVDREDLETQSGKLFCGATHFLGDKAIKVFESRNDLANEMTLRESGGIYITTIQKFTSELGLLSQRSNIICMSDEAHRTQNNTGRKMNINDPKDIEKREKAAKEGKLGAFFSYGFAKYLRDALPNATYVGFTGTPIDEAIHVFGGIVDRYTMRQSKEDGITVDIKYEPRLARVFLNMEDAQKVEEYYKQQEKEGAKAEDIDLSKKQMSSMNVILGDKKRLTRLADDVISHYESFCETQPNLVQKAMIVCSDRKIAFDLYNILTDENHRPQWKEKRKYMDKEDFMRLWNIETQEQMLEQEEKLPEVPFINIIATRDKDDEKEMYNLLGDKKHRKQMDVFFKNEKSNFHIAIVVDMWITGFDVPCLSVMYNDKPLQKHTLIQTISRVNRKYKEKEFGLIVDYLGIRDNMLLALKKYGGDDDSIADDVEQSHIVLINELKILKELTNNLDFTPFFGNVPLERLMFLQTAADFIIKNSVKQKGKVSLETQFTSHVKRLRTAFNICNPSGILTDEEVAWSQCFMGIASYLNKISNTQHDVEYMNKQVEAMVKQALSCTGVESIIDSNTEEDIFDEAFMKDLDKIKMPHTKFQLLLKMLQKAIKEYSKVNKTRAKQFEKLLEQTVDAYNTRDNLVFTNEVAEDAVNSVSDVVEAEINKYIEKLVELFNNLKLDKEEFKKLGISFEEKAFYDILVELRNKHNFEYADEKCIDLAKKIKDLIDNTSIYADWLNNMNIRNRLASELTKLLYKNGYPPTWSNEIYEKVLEQVENYKEYNSKNVNYAQSMQGSGMLVAENGVSYGSGKNE